MVGVVKIEGLTRNVSVDDIGKFFFDNGAGPDNIHVLKGPHDSTAFMIYTVRGGPDKCLQGHGSIFKGSRLSVKMSNPQEFDRFFPGVPMIKIRKEDFRYRLEKCAEEGGIIIKVENLNTKTVTGEIRKHFKDKDARPDQVHIVPGKDRDHHTGVAYLIFDYKVKADNALLLDGSYLKEHKLSVKKSTPHEFNEDIIIKVQGLHTNTVTSEIRKHFKEKDARPSDIHILPGKDRNEHSGTAFLIFTSRREADNALHLDGTQLKDFKLVVSMSNSDEFDQCFPSRLSANSIPKMPRLGRQKSEDGRFNSTRDSNQLRNNNSIGSKNSRCFDATRDIPERFVVKVKGLESKTVIGEIRKHFKYNDARPGDIHIVSGMDHNEHTGVAFLIFTNRREAENALHSDGTRLREHWLTVSMSNPIEFAHYFPETHMITKKEKVAQRFQGVLKVMGLHLNTKPSEIRQYFKENGGRPIDIHIIRGTTNDHHDCSALLVYIERREMDAALEVNGKYFRDKKLSVVMSSSEEFNHFFPGVSMISKISSRRDKPLKFRSDPYQRDAFGSRDRSPRHKRYDERRDRSRSPHRDRKYEERRDRSISPHRRHQSTVIPDLSSLNGVDNGNPQLQNLLTILTATVTAMANQQQKPSLDQSSIRPNMMKVNDSGRRLEPHASTPNRSNLNGNNSGRRSSPGPPMRPRRALPPPNSVMRNLLHPSTFPPMSREHNWSTR